MRFDIDRKVGGMRIRGWILVVNFIFNAIAMYGLSRVMVQGTGWPVLTAGVLGTVVCLYFLTQPSGINDDQ